MRLERLRHLFLSPSYRISDATLRARAEVFVAIVIFRMFVVIAIMAFLSLTHEGQAANFVPVLLLNVAAYFGARTKFIRWAALAIIVEPILSIPIVTILDPVVGFGLGSPAWLILGPLIGGLILTPWYNMLVIAGSCVAYVAMLVGTPADRTALLTNQFVLFISVAVLSIMYGFLRQRLDKGMEENRAMSLHSAKLASLGEMAGNVAHELNSPLAAISLNVEMLEEDLRADKLSNTEALEKLQSINEVAGRMAKVINGLRTFAREGNSFEQRNVPASEWVERSLELCRQRFHNAGVQLRVGKEGFETVSFVQSVQMSQALLNLLNNSFDAVSSLPEKWIQVEARKDGGQFELQVVDSGRGISKTQIPQVFKPFYTTKNAGQGAGLGLVVAKGILENHGGELIYDEKHEHTRFIFRLPIVKLALHS